MYVDNESCFIVFDFLQILYVTFIPINYIVLNAAVSLSLSLSLSLS